MAGAHSKPRIPSEKKEGMVVILSDEGYSQREIARRVGCSQRNMVQKQINQGNLRNKAICGRKRKTTPQVDRIIVRTSKADRFKTAPQIKAELSLNHRVNISTSTTQRR